jgi:hypothetical protein
MQLVDRQLNNRKNRVLGHMKIDEAVECLSNYKYNYYKICGIEIGYKPLEVLSTSVKFKRGDWLSLICYDYP